MVPRTPPDPEAETRIRRHYLRERELAERLRRATREERLRLYPRVYDELYRTVGSHTLLARKASADLTSRAIAWQLGLLKPFLPKEGVVLEVGSGDCAVAMRICREVRRVCALDVSLAVTNPSHAPSNFHLLITDGLAVPLREGTIDLVFSNQLMEHLHPDDAREQLGAVYDALKPGGKYVCVTPNRLGGPWDISSDFDSIATGLHLREYLLSELRTLFLEVGFRKVWACIGGRGHYYRFPVTLLTPIERLLLALDPARRKKVARSPIFRGLLGIRLVGLK